MCRRCFLWVAAMLLVSAGLASAQQKVGQLRAVGAATVYVMPDTAELSFSVRAEDKSLTEARQRAAVTMEAVLSALRKLKIEGLTMNTDSIRVTPLYEPVKGPDFRGGPPGYYGDDTLRKTVGYRLSNSVSVNITGDADRLKQEISRVTDAALVAGADSLYGPSLRKSDTSEAQNEAIEKATRSAVAHLQAMARGLGVPISRYTYVSLYGPEEPSDVDSNIMYLRGDVQPKGPPGPPGAASPVEIQSIPVEVTVWANAEYALPGG